MSLRTLAPKIELRLVTAELVLSPSLTYCFESRFEVRIVPFGMFSVAMVVGLLTMTFTGIETV